MNQQIQTPEQAVKAAQIVTFAMVAGIVSFGGIAVVVGGLHQDEDAFLSMILGGISLGPIVMSLVLPSLISPERIQSRQTGAGSSVSPEMVPYQVMFTRVLLRSGILEGAALLNLIAYLLEGQWWSIGLAGVILLILLTNFPTASRFHHYAEMQNSFSNPSEH